MFLILGTETAGLEELFSATEYGGVGVRSRVYVPRTCVLQFWD